MKAIETLEQIQNQLKNKAERIIVDVEVKQGTLKEQSVRVVLELSKNALTSAAELVAKGRLEKPAATLREEAAKLERRQEALTRPALEDYDKLSVKAITGQMEALGPYELKKIAAYEQTHKNRKTVLREVERRLAS